MIKSVITFLSTFCFFMHSFSQGPAIEWQRSFEGSAPEFMNCIQNTSDGGSIFIGVTQSNDGDITGNHGVSDAFVVKQTANGDVQWKKCFGGSDEDNGKHIIQTPDGGFLFVGTTKSNDFDVTGHHNTANEDAWAVKTDANGNVQWKKCYGGTAGDEFRYVKSTPDGGYIAIGVTGSTDGDVTQNHGGIDYWVVKLNSSGIIQWQKCYGGSNLDEARSVAPTSDGGYIVCGESYSTDGDVTNAVAPNSNNNDYWVIKLSASGTIQWQKSYGGSEDEVASSAHQTNDGGYLIGGSSLSNDLDVSESFGVHDFWILKVDASGTIQWDKSIGTNLSESLFGFQATSDGGSISCGYQMDLFNSELNGDMNIVKLDGNGNLQWQKIIQFSFYGVSVSVKETSDHGYILGGYEFTSSGTDGFSVIKLEGTTNSLISASLTDSFSISPNPSTGKFTLHSNQPENISSLQVFDTQGKLVSTLPNGISSDNIIDLSHLCSGIYFLHVVSDFQKSTLKIELTGN